MRYNNIRNLGWPNLICQLRKIIEQFSSRCQPPAIEAKCKLVEICVNVSIGNDPLVRSPWNRLILDDKAGMSQKRAFTLIELVAVCAIIAILIGLLFPAIRSVTEKANAVKCINNLRQIGVAIILYAGDNEQRLPGPCYIAVTYSSSVVSLLDPYLRSNKNVWECPSHPTVRGVPPGFTSYVQGNGETESYFGYPAPTYQHPFTLLQLQAISDPRKRWLLEDIDGWNYGIVSSVVPKPAHNGGRNVLYSDWSVRWVKSEKNKYP
ncbi:MAG: type II secretion system protein [Phycisphaerae bacterium]|jgi:prepilin-type N-terminal cleavage/methylation domain-containing protein/prepilin-type processing-associated H-X9-DG protein